MKPMTYWLIGCLTIGPASGIYAAKFPACKQPSEIEILAAAAVWPAMWSGALVAVLAGYKSKDCAISAADGAKS